MDTESITYNQNMMENHTAPMNRLARNAMNNQSIPVDSLNNNRTENIYTTAADSKDTFKQDFSNDIPQDQTINDQQRQQEIQMAIEEVRRRNDETERIKLIQRLQRIAGKDAPSNIQSLDINHLRRLTMEYRSLRQSEVIVKLFRRLLVFTCRVIEHVSNSMDNKHRMVDLRGWAESMQIEIDIYEEQFYDIYEYYLNSLSDNPIIILTMMVATNAAQHSMERKMYSMLNKAGATKEDFANIMSQMKKEEMEEGSTTDYTSIPGRSVHIHHEEDTKHMMGPTNKSTKKKHNNNNRLRSSRLSTIKDDDQLSAISLLTDDINLKSAE